ncbi:PIN domain-containing protein [Litorivicinus lipolyticus]|uniref:PIN domain-containing protein n=1 Tax=Litorivicinus lipolyticus TaxID=418701 RepID=UPI003B5A26A2
MLDEFQRFFKKQYHDANTAERYRIAMETAFPEASVADYTPLISLIELPDVNDRHVVACAIKTKASVIVTENLKDFPIHVLAPYDLFAIGIDDFIADTIDLAPIDAVTAIRLMRARFRNPKLTPNELMVRIEKIGLTQTASLLERYADFLKPLRLFDSFGTPS